MPLRILLVASEVPPLVSGVARSVGDIVDGLRSRGHDVEVLSARSAGYLERGDFRVSALGMRLPGVRRHLDSYDIVNLHGPAPSISELFLAGVGRWRRRGGPAVVYTHHFTLELPQRWLAPLTALYNRVLLCLARRADAVVVTSTSYAQLLERAGVGCVHVIPWGVKTTPPTGLAAGNHFDPGAVDPRVASRAGVRNRAHPLRVLYVGQLRPYKGADVAITAVARLDDVTLKVIGKGPTADALDRQIEQHADGQIERLGYCDDAELDSWYQWADVVVLPSRSRLEAFGIVLLEGMAAGCVPVASDLPGIRDVVGRCGLLAAPGDADDLAWALQQLARRPELRAEFSARSLERACEFTVEQTVDRYEALFTRLAAVGS